MSNNKYLNKIRDKIRESTFISGIEKDIRVTIEHPIDNLGYQLSWYAGIGSALYGGILWLYYLFTGEYGGAIENIKSGDLGAFMQLQGELGRRYYSDIPFMMLIGLLGIALVAVVAKGLHYRRKAARRILLVLFMICLIALTCAVIFPYCIDYFAQDEQIYDYIMEVGIEQIEETWSWITIAIACCTLITLCVICFGQKVRDDGQLWLFVCLLTTAGVPLIISILENILRLIGLGLMAVLIMVVFWVFTHGDSDAEVSTPAKSSGSSASSRTPAKPRPSSQKIKNTECVDRGFLGCKVYRVHGVLHDYIEYDNGVGTREIGSLDDLRKGKFHIIDKSTKRAICEHEIPWKR